MAAFGLAAEGEESSELPVGFVPTVKTWAWVALQLRLVPELLLAVRLLHMSLASLPLDEASQARLRDSIQDLDVGFGSNILNMTDGELRSLSSLPDALENNGMPIARMVLLYSLGHEDALREDEGYREVEAGGGIGTLLTPLKAQPVSRDLVGRLVLNAPTGQVLETCICGLTVEVTSPGSDAGTVIGQVLEATFEAMLATMIEDGGRRT